MGEIPEGAIRIGARDLKCYEMKNGSWKKSNKNSIAALHVAELFKKHNRLGRLVDTKDKRFLKGQLSPEGKIQGARINILPNGMVLDKSYSLFAKNLIIHDESSHDHWDVIYQNPNGKYAYLYTLEKKKRATQNKYKKVQEFEKVYEILRRSVHAALKDEKDEFALPMYTLLKTYMRVGSEMYYKLRGHKGLATLQKRDVSIDKNVVSFKYLAKNGVPMVVSEPFPFEYVQRLNLMLKRLKKKDFVFTHNGSPMKDTHFMAAFEKYCGKKFFPHIVRSYYATAQVKKFLRKHKSATKKEVRELYGSIAEKLGHKKFSKKDNTWKENYNVTVHYYLQPELFEKVNALTQ